MMASLPCSQRTQLQKRQFSATSWIRLSVCLCFSLLNPQPIFAECTFIFTNITSGHIKLKIRGDTQEVYDVAKGSTSAVTLPRGSYFLKVAFAVGPATNYAIAPKFTIPLQLAVNPNVEFTRVYPLSTNTHLLHAIGEEEYSADSANAERELLKRLYKTDNRWTRWARIVTNCVDEANANTWQMLMIGQTRNISGNAWHPFVGSLDYDIDEIIKLIGKESRRTEAVVEYGEGRKRVTLDSYDFDGVIEVGCGRGVRSVSWISGSPLLFVPSILDAARATLKEAE